MLSVAQGEAVHDRNLSRMPRTHDSEHYRQGRLPDGGLGFLLEQPIFPRPSARPRPQRDTGASDDSLVVEAARSEVRPARASGQVSGRVIHRAPVNQERG